MNKKVLIVFVLLFNLACGSQFNKGVIAKKELRKKKPPSVQIAEEFDKKAGKTKIYSNPKRAAKAREKQSAKQKKRGDKYLKKKNKKKSN